MDDEMGDAKAIDSSEDLNRIEFVKLSEAEVNSFHFADVVMAFEFYNMYAKSRGFSGRKSKTRRTRKGMLVQQKFVCFREGHREVKYLKMENRKREPKPETRCGCKALMQVRVEMSTGRWLVTMFSDNHNHDLLDPKFYGMLPTHRKMTTGDIGQMNVLRSVGISTPHIYGSLAIQSGGYQHIGFGIRDMYNQVVKQRQQLPGDARSALGYLREMGSSDPGFFFSHDVDTDGVLRHIFWCDGISQKDYELFGDVVAFDATYKKNKYRCPLVIFSGVNHHNQTVVFGGALVSDETEDTYVWLLENFLSANRGKPPRSVITDGDHAMRNAIRKVFPNSSHRLCAWHLMRNATSNIGKAGFTQRFRRCMLGDFEVGDFRREWFKMVEEFEVQDRPWIIETYEKRHMWATAHLRGRFFGGFRTTSRCEGLHAVLAKYVKSRYNLTEFLHHYHRMINHMRYKELQADFAGALGEPVLQTNLCLLERSASNIYTREIFYFFRPLLHRACTLKVVHGKQTASSLIYVVEKYCTPNIFWHVSFYEHQVEYKCSCMRMESLGIPCEHIIAVLVFRNVSMLPESLILTRWTKNAKEGLGEMDDKSCQKFDAMAAIRYGCLVDFGRQMAAGACVRPLKFTVAREILVNLINFVNDASDDKNETRDDDPDVASSDSVIRDLHLVNSKGRMSESLKRKRQRCGVCRVEGHNKTSCPVRRHNDNSSNSITVSPLSFEDAVDGEVSIGCSSSEIGDFDEQSIVDLSSDF